MSYEFDANVGEEVHLPRLKSNSWPKSIHIFDEEGVWAIQAALGAQRPLLLRGEPGVGKSQLARAVAVKMKRVFIPYVVHARSESCDLQYSFDSVARLGEVQALSGLGENTLKHRLDPLNFLCPGVLWWAFDWQGAEDQFTNCRHNLQRPLPIEGWSFEKGSVVLIDEIDKADADLSNGLLETLGNGGFTVPYLSDPIGLKDGAKPPLVIITTNEERELPAAFLRRCMVCHLALPEDEKILKELLTSRGKVHFKDQCSKKVMDEAAGQLIEDRKSAIKMGHYPYPGQAEYLDLLRALIYLGKNENEQLNKLEKIKNFALRKHPV